jgi:nitrogen regulatory protein P-II 2
LNPFDKVERDGKRNRKASAMKYIIAVIQPHRLDAVREALAAIGVQGLTVSEVRGFGRQKGQTEVYRGAEYTMHYVPKAKLEIAVDDALADQVVETIGDSARTGRIGDGKVFVLDLEGAMRVRTGEMGADAL